MRARRYGAAARARPSPARAGPGRSGEPGRETHDAPPRRTRSPHAPFAMRQPTVRMEATDGMTDAGRPTVPGSAQHMRTVCRWTNFEEDASVAVVATQDAPLVQVGGITIPYAPYPQSLAQDELGTLHHVFRYSVAVGEAPHTSGPGLGMRTAGAGGRSPLAVRGLGEEAEAPGCLVPTPDCQRSARAHHRAHRPHPRTGPRQAPVLRRGTGRLSKSPRASPSRKSARPITSAPPVSS